MSKNNQNSKNSKNNQNVKNSKNSESNQDVKNSKNNQNAWNVDTVKKFNSAISTLTARRKHITNSNGTPCETDVECYPEQSGYSRVKNATEHERLKYLDDNLPSLRSTVESLVALIMSRPLITTEPLEQERLNTFLNNHNVTGETNKDVLIDVITDALIYKRCGLRYLGSKKGWVKVPSTHYSIIYEEDFDTLGVNKVVGYLLSRTNTGVVPYGETYNVTNQALDPLNIDLERDFLYNEQLLYLKANRSDFQSFYFYGSLLEPDTPLNHDKIRIELYIQLVENLLTALGLSNISIDMIKLKENLLQMNNIKASDLVSTSEGAGQIKTDGLVDELVKFARTVSQHTGRSSLVVPPTVDSLEDISATARTADFLSLYDSIEQFIAKLYGVSENVLSLSKIPRDASSSPLFEQMMKTSVYPKRENIIRFIIPLLDQELHISSLDFEEESYAISSRLLNAQSVANVISTLESALANNELSTINYQDIIDNHILNPLRKGVI